MDSYTSSKACHTYTGISLILSSYLQQQTIAVEVHNGGHRQPANYTALVCTEILWNLSRSLTQQAEVRRTLYQVPLGNNGVATEDPSPLPYSCCNNKS